MSPARARFARAAVWLIAAWVLAGAVFKLEWGTPALLPRVLQRIGPDVGLVYKLAIGIELAIVAVALTKPRWGWWLQVALLGVFDLVLTSQIADGETNCGCFGAGLHVDPRVMMAIDSALLVALLASRPWASLGPGLPLVVPVALAAVGLALPWFRDREVKPGEIVVDGQTVEGAFMDLPLEKWIGKDVWDTPLGQAPLNEYLDVTKLPLDGLWVFWRATCEHCAHHLAHLAETEHGEHLITLIQVEEASDTVANRVVNVLPDGNFVQSVRLPPAFQYLLQTPGELLLEGGKIVAAKEGATPETSVLAPPH